MQGSDRRLALRIRQAAASTAGRRPRKLVACGVLLLTGYALCGPASAQPAPVFTEEACDLPDVSPGILPRLRCGTVSVPRDYSHPGGGRFALAVVVVQSADHPSLPDPLLYISGGPGGPLTVYAGYQAAHPYAPSRDLILVDQRGTGRSEPHLCPDLKSEFAGAIAAVAMGPEAPMQTRRRAVYAACREQAGAQGIDLKDFGTSITVEDFNAVRQALGVARWNVFGVSYGTTVAMTLMARYPETVRAAVLDSVNPPDPLLPLHSSNVAEARNAFFRFCNGNRACASAFPNLAGTYEDTLERLKDAPPSVRLPAEMRYYPGNQGPLTASLFEFVVGRLIYYPRFYPGLPRLIATVHDGDTSVFAASLASLLAEAMDRDTGMSFAANAAVDCRDRPGYRTPTGSTDISEQLSLYGICDGWSELGPPPVVPLNAEMPTLVLAGEFDPNATPAVSRHIADLIGPHAQWVEFARSGHSVRSTTPCASKIVADFVDQPARPLDTSCASRPEPIRFLPRQ